MLRGVDSPGTIIWDFDGTLATREFSWDRAFLDALSSVRPGHSVDQAAIWAEFNRGFPWHLPEDELVERVDTKVWWARMEAFFVEVFTRLGFGDVLWWGLPPECIPRENMW